MNNKRSAAQGGCIRIWQRSREEQARINDLLSPEPSVPREKGERAQKRGRDQGHGLFRICELLQKVLERDNRVDAEDGVINTVVDSGVCLARRSPVLTNFRSDH